MALEVLTVELLALILGAWFGFFVAVFIVIRVSISQSLQKGCGLMFAFILIAFPLFTVCMLKISLYYVKLFIRLELCFTSSKIVLPF